VEHSEQAKYEKMWNIQDYRGGSPDESHLDNFMTFIEPGCSINVYGCGAGRAGLQLSYLGHTVHMVDIAKNALDERVNASLGPGLHFHRGNLTELHKFMPCAAWGYSCDVLEHLPTAWVRPVLKQIFCLTRQVYFYISGVPDAYGKKINDVLHLTVKPADWWEHELKTVWPADQVCLRRDDRHSFNFICGGV